MPEVGTATCVDEARLFIKLGCVGSEVLVGKS